MASLWALPQTTEPSDTALTPILGGGPGGCYLLYVRPRLVRAKRSRESGEPWAASGPVTDPLG